MVESNLNCRLFFLILNHKKMIEKEELLKTFGEKLGEPDANGNYEKIGISQRTLDAYVDAISKLGVESADEAFLNCHISILESMGGQMRKMYADFVKSYKPTQEPTKEEEPIKKETPTEESPKEDDALKAIHEQLKQVLELNTTLTSRLDQMEAKEKVAQTTKAVADAMKAKGANDAYVLNNVLKSLQLEDGKSADDLANDMMAKYDEELKECRGIGATPRNGTGGTASSKELEEYFAEKFANK